MLNAHHILHLHDAANAHGHNASLPTPTPTTPFDQLVLNQHQANFDLWHREDDVRDPLAADADIVQAKHDIDALNQRRNDLAEQLDLALIALIPTQAHDAPLHSETPGMMIDRLSILSLKIFHTQEESHRSSASPEHHARNHTRLALLLEQRNDLAACLDTLWLEIQQGRRRFKLYRQLKMYNDPDLNPVLYTSAKT